MRMTTTLLTAVALTFAGTFPGGTSNEAIASAVSIYEQLPNPTTTRLIWIPPQTGRTYESLESEQAAPGLTPEQTAFMFHQVAMDRARLNALDVTAKVINEVLSSSPILYPARPAVAAETLLVPAAGVSTHGNFVIVDLLELSRGDVKRLAELLSAWELMLQRSFLTHSISDTGGKRVIVERPSLSADLATLKALCGSQVPVVHWQHFVTQATESQRDGLYYTFQGYKVGDSRDTWLADKGAFPTTADSLGGTRAVFIQRRGPTRKSGKVRWTPQLNGMSHTAFSTFDLDEANVFNVAKNPRLNLLNFSNHDAEEHLALAPNGLLHGMLSNARGQIQAVAPPTVAQDETNPVSQQLEAIHSCIRCHRSGFQSLSNDVPRMVRPGGQDDIFADLAEPDRIKALQEISRLYYGGDEEHVAAVIEARTTYNVACRQVTSGRHNATSINALQSQAYADYYEPVSSWEAANWLGLDERDLSALPRRPSLDGLVQAESLILIALRNGESVQWHEWQQVYAEAAERIAGAQ